MLGTDTSQEAEMQLSLDVKELIKYKKAYLARAGEMSKNNMRPLTN